MTQKDKDFITEILAQKQTKSTFNNDNARVLFDWGVKIGVIVITFYIVPLSTKVSELRDFMIVQQSNNQIFNEAVKDFKTFMSRDFYDIKDHESNIKPLSMQINSNAEDIEQNTILIEQVMREHRETSERIDKKQEQIINLLADKK
jgi:hypothetical protein